MSNQDESLLLYLNEAIATTRDRAALFKIVTEKLRLIFPFDTIAIITLDAEGKTKRLFLRDYLADIELPAGLNAYLDSSPVAGSPIELFVADPSLRTVRLAEIAVTYPHFHPFNFMRGLGVEYMTIVALRTSNSLLGLLCLASQHEPAFESADLHLLEKIGGLVAVAVSNTLAFEEIARREQEKSLQLAVNNALLSIKERGQLFQTVVTEINKVVPCNYFGIRVQGRDGKVQAFAEYNKQSDGTFAALDPRRWVADREREAMQAEMFEIFTHTGLYTGSSFEELAQRFRFVRSIHQLYGTQAILCAPLWVQTDTAAMLLLASHRPDDLREESLATILTLVPQIALAMKNLFAFEQIQALQAQLERERTYLIDEINTGANFGEFIGQSAAIQSVFTRVAQVAPTDTTVLITGETGTGKELAARALHNLSPRKDRALVKLNCAALPAQLIESELFGHEKGAFTGAVDRRIGKFELADGGTIFLDEIGELPLDLQAKLLRVLQEKEFERIGGRRVIRADVRVIAATNRVLEEEVAAGRFRADLYYRLNVFPLRLPALRERPEDIEPLARHFLERFTKQMGKPVRGLRAQDLRALQQYVWPGNIRELEHVLEQAVIVSRGAFLEFTGFAAITAQPQAPGLPMPLKTLKEQERDHILAALHRTSGRVSGPNGAAVLLDINPKTLEARMKKLGIRRLVGLEA